jgi:hypothetical protein
MLLLCLGIYLPHLHLLLALPSPLTQVHSSQTPLQSALLQLITISKIILYYLLYLEGSSIRGKFERILKVGCVAFKK